MKNISFFAAAFLPVVLLVSSCGGEQTDPAAELAKLKDQKAGIEARIIELEKQVTQPAPRLATVSLTEIKPSDFKHFIDLQGKVEATESVVATAKMPGSLKRVYVQNGDNVKKGQLLAEIDSDVMLKGMAELEGQLVTATDIFNRQKGLWDQKIGAEVAYIQAKNAKESLERSLATMKEQMNMTKIYAPTSGSVDVVMLRAGQAIAPGMPLCNIVNLSDLRVRGEVTEAYAAKVRQGDPVQIFFPDLDKEVASRVRFVSKTINPMTRTFTVECTLPSGEYRANQIAVMKIIDYQKPGAIAIPVNMIQTSEDGDFVLVAEKTGENQAVVKKASIKQGQNYAGNVEIVSGLKKGDWLISTGYQETQPGETVNF
jgi:RND family efflux transporter MFP subunit